MFFFEKRELKCPNSEFFISKKGQRFFIFKILITNQAHLGLFKLI